MRVHAIYAPCAIASATHVQCTECKHMHIGIIIAHVHDVILYVRAARAARPKEFASYTHVIIMIASRLEVLAYV